MLPDILSSLLLSQGAVAFEALLKSIKKYRLKNSGSEEETEGLIKFEYHTDDGVIDTTKLRTIKKVSPEVVNELITLIKPYPGKIQRIESPLDAASSTREIIDSQLTILEQERNRLIPIAAREHWVALVFAIIAGIVFFTSIALVIFATLPQAGAAFVASIVPGFMSKVFFSREAIAEARLKEIASDLRESEKAKERLEIIEEALKVIPEEHRERVLEEFTRTKRATPARRS